MTVALFPAWTSETKSVVRIVVGLLIFRLGMEQALGFPDPSDAPRMSFQGIVQLLGFPGGLLLMLGCFTRPVALAFSALYLMLWVAGPLAEYVLRGVSMFGSGSPSDPMLLNAFFLLYLGLTGAGIWSVDQLRDPSREQVESRWAPHALFLLRVVAGFLFLQHGIPKLFGAELPPIVSTRFLAGVLECVGGPLLMLGLFTRSVAFILSGEMAFAYFMTFAPRGFWGSFAAPNMEAAILDCFVFLLLWRTGPGSWSLDALWPRRRASALSSSLLTNPVRPS